MTGMSRYTGEIIDGLEHLRQRVGDILSTPIGTRVGRRDYGSLLFEFIDQPMTGANILRLYAATALALSRSDRTLPLRLRQVSLVAGDRPGAAALTIDGERTDTPALNSRASITLPLKSLGQGS